MHQENVDVVIKAMQMNLKIGVYYAWRMSILIYLSINVKNVLSILTLHLDQLVVSLVCHNNLAKKVILLFLLQIVIHRLWHVSKIFIGNYLNFVMKRILIQLNFRKNS